MGSNKSRIGASIVVMILSALSRSYYRYHFYYDDEPEHHLQMYTGPSEQTVGDYQKRAQAALENKDLDGAISALNDAIKIDPSEPAPRIQRAGAYLIKHDLDKALSDCEAALKQDPKSAEGHYVRGLCYERQKDFDKALADFTTALAEKAENVECYLHRGRVYGEQKEYAKALADLNMAVQLAPEKADGYAARGDVLVQNKQWTNAVADYAEAIREEPEDPQAYNGLAWLYATCPKSDVRNAKMAIEYALYACRVSDYQEPSYLDTLAAAYAEAGQFDQAVKWAKKRLEAADVKGENPARKRAEARLHAYRDHKPCRDVTP